LDFHRERPIKILRILGRINVGGPAIHAVLLTEGLNSRLFHSTLVVGTVGRSEGDMRYFAQAHGVCPIIVPELGREISWRDDIVAFWKLFCLCRQERPDIVHTHTAKAGTLGRIAALLAGVPVKIHTFHGHVFHGYFGWLKTKLFVLIERFLAHFTTKIVAISEAQLADLFDRYRIAPRGKFCVIPLGLDLAALLADGSKVDQVDRNQDQQSLAVGFIGRLVPIKNPFLAVRAFERFLGGDSTGHRAQLIIVGDGELKAELQKQIRLAGLDEKVILTGWQSDRTKLYAGLDLVLLTSRNEGTPVVLIESMAAGLPFVASRVGGVVDLLVGSEQVVRDDDMKILYSVFDNGILVEPGNVEGFRMALEYFAGRPDVRRQMGAKGREFVRQRFTKERLLTDIEQLYRECLPVSSGLPFVPAADSNQFPSV